MKIFIPVILALALMSGAMTGTAQATDWDVDKAHSSFYFTINHIYSKVHGTFTEYDGTVRFDPADLAASKIAFEIAVKSVHTGITKRDGHLRSGDFFDAGKYPAMRFTSTSISHKGGNAYEVTGDFTIKDVTKTITVPFTYHPERDNPVVPGKVVAGFDATLTIDRLDYHVGNGQFHALGVVGKDVEIIISLEVLRDK